MPYLGKPKPVITWKMIRMLPVEGEPVPADAEEVELEPHVTIRNAAAQSTLYIRTGDRYDTGIYVMRVTVGDKGTRLRFFRPKFVYFYTMFLFLHQKFYFFTPKILFFYTKNFTFFSSIFLQQKIYFFRLIFLHQNFCIFRPFFYTNNFTFLHQKKLLFLH